MALSAIQAARDYVEEAARRHVLAISPRTVSTRLGCTDEQAVAILKTLRDEGRGVFRGHVKCQSCGETIPLRATALIDMIGEANGLGGSQCRYCDEPLALPHDEIEVHLSFFLEAVADGTATAGSPVAVTASEQTGLSLGSLRKAEQMQVGTWIVVESGGSLHMQTGGNEHIQPAGNDPDRANITSQIAAHGSLSGEHSTDVNASSRGKETYRRKKTSSGLLGLVFGHVEEERHREGEYSEKTAVSKRRKIAIGITIAVAVLVTATIVVLISVFRQ